MSPPIPARSAARTAPRLLAAFGLASLATAVAFVCVKYREKTRVHPSLATVPVRRADVDAVVLTSGLVASSRSTEIRCTLERLEAPASGTSAQAAIPKEGASAIISLVPDGATVKKDEVICELDSSEYQELARRQQIVVEEAPSEHLRASVTLEAARMALRSYREG